MAAATASSAAAPDPQERRVSLALPPKMQQLQAALFKEREQGSSKKDEKSKPKITIEFVDNLAQKGGEATADEGEFGVPFASRYKSGGLVFNDPDAINAQKGVAKDLIKSFGSNLLQGKSVVNISLPVRIFEPRSFLQRIPDAWSFAPIYLTKAALATDPVERFKLCIAFFISGLHRNSTQRKPFNPILGETFQATYVDGSQIYLEQVAHHPPVSAFQVFGPDNLYQLHGQHEFKASFRPTGIIGGQFGQNHIDFPDGTRVTYEMPGVELSGIIMGDRVCNWTGESPFTCAKHGLEAKIAFNPDRVGGISQLWSSAKTPSDTIRGTIIQTVTAANGTSEKKSISEITGSWLDGLNFDGKSYWKKLQYKPFPTIPVRDALPSDCNFREDLLALKNKDQQLAQQLKNLMEEKQRKDAALRKAAAKSAKKAGTPGAATH